MDERDPLTIKEMGDRVWKARAYLEGTLRSNLDESRIMVSIEDYRALMAETRAQGDLYRSFSLSIIPDHNTTMRFMGIPVAADPSFPVGEIRFRFEVNA